MNEIKIPKEFQLFGIKIIIEFNEDRCDDKNAFGLAEFGKQKIVLCRMEGRDLLPTEKVEKIYFHEVTHQILDYMHEFDLSKNEKFVNIFSSLLHQALKTAKY